MRRLTVLFVAFSAVTLFTGISIACKDCGFPTKLSDDTWLMPNKKIAVELHEKRAAKGFTKYFITLFNPDDETILAAGMIMQLATKTSIAVRLVDYSGETVRANIKFLDPLRTKLQIELNCNSCAIESLIRQPVARDSFFPGTGIF